MNRLNRLTLLAAAGAMPIAASPVAVALAGSHHEADRELMRLGAEFDRAEAELLLLWREWRRCDALWRETIIARGIRVEDSEESFGALDAVHREVGATAASDANDAGIDRLDRIRNAIQTIKPTTIAGLAVWAKIARFDGTSYFERAKAPGDRDFQAAAILDFIDVVEAMAATAVQS